MGKDEMEATAERLKKTRTLLESIEASTWESVSANVRLALIAVNQALYTLGREGREEQDSDWN